MSQPLITFEQLSVSFAAEQGRVQAVQEVSFTIHAGQTLGIVGESGCGKSVTAMSLMGLLPPQAARTDGGAIRSQGHALLTLNPTKQAYLRGNQLATPFQEPMCPPYTVLTLCAALCEHLLRLRVSLS